MKTQDTATPGPWSALLLEGEKIQSSLVLGTDGHTVVARCRPAFGQALGNITQSESMANARLIAAAPELRDALQALALEVSHLIHGNGGNEQSAANEVRNALALLSKLNP